MKRLGSAASLHANNLSELIGFAVMFVTVAYRRMRPRATT
jgi:hypothetical protein